MHSFYYPSILTYFWVDLFISTPLFSFFTDRMLFIVVLSLILKIYKINLVTLFISGNIWFGTFPEYCEVFMLPWARAVSCVAFPLYLLHVWIIFVKFNLCYIIVYFSFCILCYLLWRKLFLFYWSTVLDFYWLIC